MKYKTIVIGSSTGIGLAITKKLLDRNHKVTGVSRRGLNLDNELYNHLKLDVSDKDFIFKIKNEIALKEYNNLIYCVGINNIKLAKECSQEDLENIFKVNLIPALLISFEFSKTRNDSLHSSILFVGSIWSAFGLKGRSIYGASKAALSGFAKHLSAEISDAECLVNVISPGFTDTELTKRSYSDPLIQKSLGRVKGKILIKPDAIADLCYSLIRPNNKCITGQEIFADGGFSGHA